MANKCRSCDRDLPTPLTVCKYCLDIESGVHTKNQDDRLDEEREGEDNG